jgi:hypothetical protein
MCKIGCYFIITTHIIVKHVRKSSCSFLVVSGGATAQFVEEAENLFDSFYGVTRVDLGKTLHFPLSGDSPYVGHWTKASMGVSSWIFLKDGKPTFSQPPHSQIGWLMDIAASCHVWRTVKTAGSPFENTLGAICFHCGSNSNQTVGQFVGALKTSIINGLAFSGLHGTKCEDDGTPLLDDLHSLLKVSDASPPNSSTSHSRENPDDVYDSLHVSEAVQQKVAALCAGDIEVFSVAYVSGFIARQLLCGVNCDT